MVLSKTGLFILHLWSFQKVVMEIFLPWNLGMLHWFPSMFHEVSIIFLGFSYHFPWLSNIFLGPSMFHGLSQHFTWVFPPFFMGFRSICHDFPSFSFVVQRFLVISVTWGLKICFHNHSTGDDKLEQMGHHILSQFFSESAESFSGAANRLGEFDNAQELIANATKPPRRVWRTPP